MSTQEQPTAAARSQEAPLQPSEACDIGDLKAFVETDATRRLEVLVADRDLVLELSLRGFSGSSWNQFAHALAEYGLQVIGAWLFTGLIFAKCRRKGIRTRGRSPMTSEEADELAGEVVAEAIRAFRVNVLMRGRWDPTRGASLTTFFIGQCLLQFPNAYRRWLTEGRTMPQAAAMGLASEAKHLGQAPPDVVTELTRRIGAFQPRDVGLIRMLEAMGYHQAEIAELLGLTLRSVQSRLFRAR